MCDQFPLFTVNTPLEMQRKLTYGHVTPPEYKTKSGYKDRPQIIRLYGKVNTLGTTVGTNEKYIHGDIKSRLN
jgi:hypothetical protein